MATDLEPFEEMTEDTSFLELPVLDERTGKFMEQKDFLKQQKKEAKSKLQKRIMNTGIRIDHYQENAQTFYELQPYFYDKAGIWWLWQDNRWMITDDTEMSRKLDYGLGFLGQSINASIRKNHLVAMTWLGRDKAPKEAPVRWIQFKENAFSLRSKNIHKCTPDFFFTNPIPWEMGESEETPVMDKLFQDWVGEDYVLSLYEIIAYCCYSGYPIQTLICLYGPGRNGKTCFQRLLGKFFGKDNVCSTELDVLMDSRFESFKLYKKLIAFMGETNFGVMDKSSMLKKLTGSDMIGFEKKGKDPFNDYSYAKLIIASNSLPSSNDTSDGFYRRWFIISFPNEFNEGKDILETIPEVEYNNLARKCMNILPILLERGHFHNQGSIEERKEKYILASNPLSIFLKNYFERDEDSYISYAEVYTMYVQYLRNHKKRRVKPKEFKAALEDEGYWVEKTSKELNGNWKSGYWIEGLKMKEFVPFMTNVHSFPLGKTSYVKRIENNAQLSQISQNEVIEEIIKPLSYREALECNHKCFVEGCQTRNTRFDLSGVPYCEEHWETMARR